jgi:hypothetical protein
MKINTMPDTLDFSPSGGPLAGRSLLLAAAVSLALAFVTQSGPLLKPYLTPELLGGVPYGRAALTTALDLFLFVLLLRFAGVAFADQARISGVFAPIAWPLVFAVLTLTPAILVCATSLPLAQGVTPADLAWKTFVGPFTEEVAFRGLAVGVLMRLCGWPLIAACLWPAAFFGAAHAWHGSDLAEIAGIVGITAAGGLLFGWLFVRWGFDLWPPVFLHAGLNGLWLMFDLGENAIGGWLGNVLRFGTIALAILVTLWLTRRPGAQAG